MGASAPAAATVVPIRNEDGQDDHYTQAAGHCLPEAQTSTAPDLGHRSSSLFHTSHLRCQAKIEDRAQPLLVTACGPIRSKMFQRLLDRSQWSIRQCGLPRLPLSRSRPRTS